MNGPATQCSIFFLEMRTMFFQESRTTLFQESRLCHLSAVWDRSALRVRDKDGDNKRLKITILFTRRYLGNRKSYRDKRKGVSKGKVARF